MYKVYNVTLADTLDSIAIKFNTTPDELVKLNGTTKIMPGEFIVVPSSDELFYNYVVKKGDNLYKIASNYNITVNDLALLNGLDVDEYIYPGQMLIVPKEDIHIFITKNNTTIRDIVDNYNEDMPLFNNELFLLPNQIVVYRK